MKELACTTRTFVSGKYIIDIVEKHDLFEAWITVKDGTDKMFMFGSPKKQHTPEGFRYTVDFDVFFEMVESCLPEYKKIFKQEHPEE